jgi:hypothetical protein
VLLKAAVRDTKYVLTNNFVSLQATSLYHYDWLYIE